MNEIFSTNLGNQPLSTSVPHGGHDHLDVVLLYFHTFGWLPIPAHYPDVPAAPALQRGVGSGGNLEDDLVGL